MRIGGKDKLQDDHSNRTFDKHALSLLTLINKQHDSQCASVYAHERTQFAR